MQYPATPSLNVHIAYDLYGRTASVSDGVGTRVQSFDDNNRILSAETTFTGLPTQTVGYTYHPNGALATLSTPAGVFAYSFDGAGRLSDLTNPFNEGYHWAYLDNGWVWTQSSGNVLTATSTYNALGQIQELANRKQDFAETVVSDFSGMSYDSLGNRQTMSANIPTYAAGTYNSAYQYDGRSQLVLENGAASGYDAAGNVTSNRGNLFNYNSANQITTAVTDHNQTAQYDLNGNQTSVLGVTSSGWANIGCSYDVENRLTAFGSNFTAGYFSEGARAWKQTGAGRTYYLYGGGLIPLCELDSSGAVTAVNTAGEQGHLSRHTAAGTVYYAFDPRGNTANRLDTGRNVLNSSTYTAFSSQASSLTCVDDPYDGFGGQYGACKEVGASTIYLCGLRYYSPDQCRWLTRDPTWYEGGINLYGYAQNNPITRADPRGTNALLAPLWCALNPPCAAAVAAALASGIGAILIIGIIAIGVVCVITQCWCAFVDCTAPAPARPIERCVPRENVERRPLPDPGRRPIVCTQMAPPIVDPDTGRIECWYLCSDGSILVHEGPACATEFIIMPEGWKPEPPE